MKLIIKKATTQKIIHVFIQDSSKSDGSGLTGLVYNSASLTAYYIKVGDASATVITLATTTVGTWTSSGFKEVDATNMPGVYEIGIPDACLTTVAQVVIMLKGAANMAPVVLEIQLDDSTSKDVYDRIGVAGAGLTAIPWNAAWDAEVESEATDALNAYDPPTRAEATTDKDAILADHIVMKQKVAGTYDRETDSLEALKDRGDAAWITATGFATPTNITAGVITTVTNLTNAPTVGDFNATMKTSLNAATPASVQNIPATGTGFTALGDARIANLDAAISSRSTLTQAHILSDATPFAGANVDAKISNAALASVCTEARLAELDAANLPTDVSNVGKKVDRNLALLM